MSYEDDYSFDLSDLADLWNETDDLFFEESYCSVCGQIELILGQSIPPILLLIGVPGNILTLISMHTLSSEAFPLCGYLCLTACLDTVMLFFETGNDWLHRVAHSNPLMGITTYSDTMCKLFNFSQNLIVHHDAWILVSFLIECDVLLHYPEKIRHITSRRVLDTLAFISVLLICANCHYFWTFGINKVEIPTDLSGTFQVMPFCQFQTRTLDGQIIPGTPPTAILWTTLHKVLATILPSVVFIVLLVLYLRRRRSYNANKYTDDLLKYILERQSENRENQANGLPYDRRGVQLNAVFICEICWCSFPILCLMFLFCYIPDYIHETLEQKFGHRGSPDLWSLTGVIFHIVRSICYSCKIVVFAATSKVFRKTLKVLLKKKWNMLRKGCSMSMPNTKDTKRQPKRLNVESNLPRPTSYHQI